MTRCKVETQRSAMFKQPSALHPASAYYVKQALPKRSYDQLMRSGWKVFLPLPSAWAVYKPQDLDWEEEGEKDDRNEANKHFEYYMMALVEGPKVRVRPESKNIKVSSVCRRGNALRCTVRRCMQVYGSHALCRVL